MEVKEEWRDIVITQKGITYDFTGLYQVSSFGRIRSLNYRKTGRIGIIKVFEDGRGYLQVGLKKCGKGTRFLVHRLVANAFIPNLDNLPCVNHKNENKLDNSVDNLEWCTHEYNINYGTAMQRASESKKGRKMSEERKQQQSEIMKGKPKSEQHKKKLSEAKKGVGKKVICLETQQVFNTVKDASEWCSCAIMACLKGKNKHAGKHPETGEPLKWMYYDEWLAMTNSNNEEGVM